MRTIIAAPEAVPYAKTGGLADVAGALLKEFRNRGEKATLVLPLYETVRKNFRLYRTGRSFVITLGGHSVPGVIWSSDRSPCPAAWFVECDELYNRTELYGTALGDYHDNALRYAFFSKAVLETCLAMDVSPDIIHCNDWQTGLLPLFLRDYYRRKVHFARTATVFTIHNLGYQGLFNKSELRNAGLEWGHFTADKVEFHDMLNFMKAGLVYSDLINTVSVTYAREVLLPENGFGLDGLLKKRKKDLYGIINGIDYAEYDPSSDPFIPKHFSVNDLSGRDYCRRELVKEAGLRDEDRPVAGFVGRLASQKGLDLIGDSIDELIGMGMNMVILGRGEERYQKLLSGFAEGHRGHVSLRIGFEERLARLIYAGSDFFLMPSRYEPCGLGQLLALRYGAVPVVRRTGGLADTITDFDEDPSEGNGFVFDEYSPSALIDAVSRGLDLFADKRRFRDLVVRAMTADFSWQRSADRYLLLYEKALGKVAG
ncbi:MAG: glycogen synthase [Nitrospirae bacterium]|nr:glycogen synthase [Nitrospirota bacterium]